MSSKDATTEKLIRKLEAAGLSPARIAEKIGVHWRTVYRWREGETEPQRASDRERLEKLAGRVLST